MQSSAPSLSTWVVLLTAQYAHVASRPIAEAGRLVQLQTPVTFDKSVALLNPAASSTPSHLSWLRDDWCTLSPCITIVNTTQQHSEWAKFSQYVKSWQNGWRTPFAPSIYTNVGRAFWIAPDVLSNHSFFFRNDSHGFKYKNYIEPIQAQGRCDHWVDVSGNVLIWFNFWQNNYGHWIHDNAPALFGLLKILGSSVDWVALPDNPLPKKWLAWFDPGLLQRVIFYPVGNIVCTNATVLLPLNEHGGDGPHSWATPSSISYLNELAYNLHGAHQEHKFKKTVVRRHKKKPSKIVFTSRNSSTVLHDRQLGNEGEIIATVQRLMKHYNRTEELVVFNGEGATYQSQFALFSDASMVMGPHGSAMSNVLWTPKSHHCRQPVHVVEFVGGSLSGQQVQGTYGTYRGYYHQEAAVPWVQYHMLTFTENSTRANTFVSIDDVEHVLSWIWTDQKSTQNTFSIKCFFGV